jgi:hypothetical protein
VKLYRGSTEVTPTSLTINSTTQLTATFDLTGLDLDYWSVSVENVGCPAVATLTDAFNVVLAGPGLVNGSFEYPEDTIHEECLYGTIPDDPADYWNSIHVHPYGGGSHVRDNLLFSPSPTCPPPDGFHWASVSAPFGSYAGMRRYTQTVTVTPTRTYTLSGFFAAYGPNNLSISLLDGGYLDAALATNTVLPSGDNDWTFGYVEGSVTGDLVTAVWDTDNDAEGNKIGHADDLVLEECTAAVSVASISETTAASEGTLSVTITGSGFSGPTPAVYLVREGTTIVATNVVVGDDSTLTCDFDMSTAGFGYLDVIVGNNGCYATLGDAIFAAPAQIQNPEFENPVILDDQVPPEPALPCLGAVEGSVDIWEVSDLTKFRRDDTVLADALTCPNPNAAGGHYASLSTDQAEILQVWQVLKVIPGRNYLVGGWFAGGGSATVTLRLINATDPGGVEVASATVMQTTGVEQTDWVEGTVEGRPTDEFMTVIWELTGGGGAAASHADGFYMEFIACNDPFADAEPAPEGDGDVDQEDFAIFQMCFTGDGGIIPLDPEYCACFDVEGIDGPDGDIDERDFTRFQQCASGPAVLADDTCDD